MTLTQLRDFCVVSDHGSFRAAAEFLSVGQSTLTRSVQNLETALGASLIVRSHQGLSLTAAGQVFLVHARSLTRDWNRAAQDVRNQLVTAEGEVAIGVSIEPLAEIVLPVVELFRRRYPKVLVRVVTYQAPALFERVRSGRLDFAITSMPPHANQPGIVVQTMYASSVTVIARRNHPHASATSMRCLRDCEWVATQASEVLGGGLSQVKGIFTALGLGEPNIAVRTSSLLETLQIVSASDCLAIAPRVLVGLKLFARSLISVSTGQAFDARDICLVSRSGSVGTAVSVELLQMLMGYSRLRRQREVLKT